MRKHASNSRVRSTSICPVVSARIAAAFALSAVIYAGVGVSYNTTTITGSPATTSTGAQAEAGVSFNLAGFSAGVEYCYLIPDLNHTGNNASLYNAYMTGGFTQSFGF